MHPCSIIRLCTSGLIAAAALAAAAGAARSEKVGVASAVNPTVTGLPPGGSLRQLKIGADVVHNERIRSSGDGSMQLVFIDRTTLTLSPNCDITINEFVFNRNASSGNMAVTMGKGLMRFVGGQVSHSGEARIATPAATMGIRGGMALINNDGGKITVINLYGTVRISTGSNSTTLSKPGSFVETSGGQITPPAAAPPGLIAAYNSQLQSRAGQTAGVARGHVNFDRLRNTTSNVNLGASPDQRYQGNPQPQPQQTSLGASGAGLSSTGGGGIGGGGVGGGGGGIGGGGGGIGGGGGGIGGGGGFSGPPWGLLIAPGQTGNSPGPPPGLAIKGHKH